MKKKYIKNESSFRDPSGFIFFIKGIPHRAINFSYKDNYQQLIKSGLYKELVELGLLLPHKEIKNNDKNLYKVLKPDYIKLISYPYEWSFSQLKDAALTTLKIQEIAMQKNMSLKDASAYNIQFYNGKPVLMDILSFEIYKKDKPWIAYKQFCQHFLAPLALMSHKDIRLNSLLKNYIDGIPIDLANELLPLKSKLNFSLLTHIALHAKFQAKHNTSFKKVERKISKDNLINIIKNLKSSINSLKWNPRNTEWANYYEETNYSNSAIKNKGEIIKSFLNTLKPKIVWDLGANDGTFGRIALKKGADVVSFDVDPAAVELNYLKVKKNKELKHLPLLLDLTNPSPSIGWSNLERMSFMQRANADTVLALALIHHLAISNNVSFDVMALFFSKICKNLIIEFIPKDDSNAKKLLSTREDIFDEYTEENFINSFKKYFIIRNKKNVKSSKRTIFLMEKK